MFKKFLRASIVALGMLVGTISPAYSADCAKALVTVFGHEGGYTADRNDPGNWTGGKVGVGKLKGTKFGIAANSFPNLDIKHLTLAQAAKIYRTNYWNPLHLDRLESQAIATILFDTAVNMGTGTEARTLQEAINCTNYPRADIRVTGVIDDMTINMCNKSLNKKALYTALCGIQFEKYRAIVARNPKMDRYMVSWLCRIGDYGQDKSVVLIAKLKKRGYTVLDAKGHKL